MAIKFQYNKTSLQVLEKNLKTRVKALPTIKNKESALRIEVKKVKDEIQKLDEQIAQLMAGYEKVSALWVEFNPELLAVEDVILEERKIAGVRVPVLKDVVYKTKPFSLFNNPKWFADGVLLLKSMAHIGLHREVLRKELDLLEYARKKTTQKVNLFEKVQIPGYEDAILKIKRFMEDEDNLSKSVQKMAKNKKEKSN